MIRGLTLLVLIASFCSIDAQNDTVWNQRDQNGVMQGYWKKYTPDSILIYRGFFRDGKPLGEFHRYYENGRTKAMMNHDQDGIHSYARLFYQNGKLAAEGKYFNRSKDSTWVYYSYYSQDITSRENYVRGIMQGESYVYYSDGIIAEIKQWNHDLAYGYWKQYYEDSSLRLESNMMMGEIHGDYIIYNRMGTIVIRGRYSDGKMDGPWDFFSDEGKLEYQLNYENGINLDEEGYLKKALEYQQQIEDNMGTIPEPDINNIIPGNR